MAKYLLSAFSDEYADSFTEQLEALKKFEIDYAELRFIDKKNIAELNVAETHDVKSKLDFYGITASALGSPLGKISLDDDFNAHLEKAKNLFTIANTLDVKNIRMFSFYPHEGMDILDSENEVFEKLEKLIDLSQEYGVTLCHENEAKIYGESIERCQKIMEYFKGKIKCVFDMGNFVLDGFKPYPDGLNALKEHIEYFHIKDSLAAGAIVPAGKGEAKIKEILKEYKKDMKKDTFITLEPHLQTFSGLNALVGKSFDNPYKYPDGKTAFCDAVEKIKSILGEVQ